MKGNRLKPASCERESSTRLFLARLLHLFTNSYALSPVK